MTRMIFGGAEKGTNRSALVAAGVTNFAINVTQLNIPKRRTFDIPELFGPEASITVYTSPGDEDVERFDRFLRDHLGHIDRVVGRPDYDGKWIGERYWPVWNDDDDMERFTWLMERHQRAVVSDSAVDDPKILKRVRGMATRWNGRLMVISSKAAVIDAYDWESAIVVSWTSPTRRGETQVWDGKSLRRYPAQQKATARRRHAADIERLGVDVDAVIADDADALNLLAIRSWQQYEARTKGYRADTEESDVDDDEAEVVSIATIDRSTGEVVSAAPGGAAVAIDTPGRRHQRDRKLLPGWESHEISVQTAPEQYEGSELGLPAVVTTEEVKVIRPTGTTERQCDSCSLSSNCPEFEPRANCAFDMPVELKTKDQVNALMRSLIEMQTKRVMFASFAEHVNGDVLDGDVSKEIDRVFNMIAKAAELNSNGDVVRMTVEARGNAGVLSRLFGSHAGEAARELPGGGLDKERTSALIDTVLSGS